MVQTIKVVDHASASGVEEMQVLLYAVRCSLFIWSFQLAILQLGPEQETFLQYIFRHTDEAILLIHSS